MKNLLLKASTLALIAPVMAGCATKGWTREFVNGRLVTERSITDSSLAVERAARIAGDSVNMVAIVSLRKDLESLRTEFGAKIVAIQNGMQFDMPVNFAFDDASIRDDAKPLLDRFAQVVGKHYQGSVITIEGFADPAGSKKYNVALSERRADAVKTYLSSVGLNNDLRTVGYGYSRLVVKGAQRDEPGAEQNRRVTFVIETKGTAASGAVASSSDQNQ